MKKILLFVIVLFATRLAHAQTHTPGPAEKRITDSICNCVSMLDLSKITTKDEATKAYTNCVLNHVDLLAALAEERSVELSDTKAMTLIGENIALTLLKEECKGFKSIALLMGEKAVTEDEGVGSASGTFKRIETKGFNYVIITGNDNNERSFLWLRQFPNSENFTNADTKLVGKKVTIEYREMEVYLPQANGYYKVREITAIKLL